jgi:polyisoprenoid-binding protein YceI
MKRIVTFSVALLAFAHCTPVTAEPFVFDKGFTALTFSWSHLGLTRQTARFNGVDGSAEIDPEHPENSKIEVTIRTNSVQSGVDTFDRILRGPDYFNATTYPTITFRSTSVTRTGEKTADVEGELSILGQSKPATLRVTLNVFGAHPSADANPAYAGKKVAAFSARTQVLRSAWGMARGTPLVSDEVEIQIETELVSKE